MTSIAEIFVGLLLSVAVLAMLARKLHIPYPILFVIGGLLLGSIHGVPKVTLNPELLFRLRHHQYHKHRTSKNISPPETPCATSSSECPMD
jgi:Kef-type K+ transport system membrane component KefB